LKSKFCEGSIDLKTFSRIFENARASGGAGQLGVAYEQQLFYDAKKRELEENFSGDKSADSGSLLISAFYEAEISQRKSFIEILKDGDSSCSQLE